MAILIYLKSDLDMFLKPHGGMLKAPLTVQITALAQKRVQTSSLIRSSQLLMHKTHKLKLLLVCGQHTGSHLIKWRMLWGARGTELTQI